MGKSSGILRISILATSLWLGVGTVVTAEEPKGSIVFGQTTDIFRFDPFDLAIGNFAMLNTVYDPIVRVSAGSEPEPWLAKSWTFSEDGKKLTLELRDDVVFHSGRPMMAEDVKWSIEQYQELSNAAIVQKSAALITSMDITGEHTLVLGFDNPYATVFDLLELIFVFDKENFDSIRNTPAGTGPFILESWSQGIEARYKANENYWKDDAPHLEKFIQRVFPDPQAMVAALQAGALDVAMYPSAQDFERLKNDSSIKAVTAFGCCEVNINFNTANSPWDKKLVRQAMNHAIDRRRLVNIAFQGNSEPICQPIRSGWGHNPDISVDEECKFDLDLAKSLLDEAGMGDGFEMEALVSSSVMPESAVLAQIMKDDLAKIGITLSILDLEQTAYNNMGDKSEYKDMYIQIVGRTAKDPGSLYALTVAFRPETNVAQFRDKEYEDLIKQGLETVDQEERTRIYQRIAEIVTDEAFSLVAAARPETYLMKPEVEGFALSRDGLLLTDQLLRTD